MSGSRAHELHSSEISSVSGLDIQAFLFNVRINPQARGPERHSHNLVTFTSIGSFLMAQLVPLGHIILFNSHNNPRE